MSKILMLISLLCCGRLMASTPTYSPDELILGIQNEGALYRIPWNDLGLKLEKRLGLLPFYLVRISDGKTVMSKISEIVQTKVIGVSSAEPNYSSDLLSLYAPLAIPNDAYYQDGNGKFELWLTQWDRAVNEPTGAMATWSLGGNFPSLLAVIDTGVRSSHEDLAGRLVTGWNVLTSDSNVTDTNGHGEGSPKTGPVITGILQVQG